MVQSHLLTLNLNNLVQGLCGFDGAIGSCPLTHLTGSFCSYMFGVKHWFTDRTGTVWEPRDSISAFCRRCSPHQATTQAGLRNVAMVRVLHPKKLLHPLDVAGLGSGIWVFDMCNVAVAEHEVNWQTLSCGFAQRDGGHQPTDVRNRKCSHKASCPVFSFIASCAQKTPKTPETNGKL